MNWTTKAFMLALVMWREASGEGDEGMRAVGWVVRNRVKAGWGDWLGVITSPNQFSSISVIGDPGTVRWPKESDAAWQAARGLSDAITGDSDAGGDPTGGATFYWNAQIATSGWFKRAVGDGTLIETVQIGRHTFYREAGK